MLLNKGDRVLFQGDSVTDAGRVKDDFFDLGNGYPMLINANFSAAYPEMNIEFINKGISGNRVVDLKGRWQQDCIDLKPDVVSILIGINDTWRKYDSDDPTDAESYANDFRAILTDVKQNLDAKIIILEPFLLPVMDGQENWRIDLDPKINAVRDIVREFNALYIPLDGMFAAASVVRDCDFWLGDGVHPDMPGHGLIAKAWMEAVCK